MINLGALSEQAFETGAALLKLLVKQTSNAAVQIDAVWLQSHRMILGWGGG